VRALFFFQPVRSLLGSAGRGLPGGNSLFFCVAKRKVSKRKGDPAVCVPSLRYGQPAVLGPAGVKNNSPAAQTCFCPDPSGPALLGAYRRAGGRNTEQPTAGCRNRIPDETRTRHGVSLSVLGFGIRIRTSPSWLGRGAQRQADQGSRLSEPKASSSETPLASSTAGCPKRSAGTQTAGRLFFGDFLLAKQKKVTCRRATPGQPSSARSTPVKATQDKPDPNRGARP
jgi:hypothetical protein